MSSSLRALLGGIIDYAGLFPPAKLPLDQALRHYAKYRRLDDRWMLGRFVIPATRLHELSPLDSLFHENPPFVFSVLGRGGKTGDELLQGLNDDLRAIAEFRQRHAGRVEVDVLEVKLPDELALPESAQVLHYSLVRAAMLQAATLRQLEPQRISFADACRWLRLTQAAGVSLLKLLINPQRVRRSRPRKLKYRGKNYRWLTTALAPQRRVA